MTATTRTPLGPPREMTALDLDEARARYAAYLAGGARGLAWYDDLRRAGSFPRSALSTVRWRLRRERPAVTA